MFVASIKIVVLTFAYLLLECALVQRALLAYCTCCAALAVVHWLFRGGHAVHRDVVDVDVVAVIAVAVARIIKSTSPGRLSLVANATAAHVVATACIVDAKTLLWSRVASCG
jgi:hypothetical protein